MEKNELDFSNDLADLIEAANPTPDELSRLAARCGIEKGSLEGKATEVRIGLLVQSALRAPVLVDRLYYALPKVFPYLNKQDLELLYSTRPSSLRNYADAASTTREAGSDSRTGFRSMTPTTVDVMLIVATDIEREAVLAAFKQRGHDYIRESIGVSSCWIYPSDNTSIALLQCRMGSGGPGGSMLTAMEGITALTPEVVIRCPAFAFRHGRPKATLSVTCCFPRRSLTMNCAVSEPMRQGNLSKLRAGLVRTPQLDCWIALFRLGSTDSALLSKKDYFSVAISSWTTLTTGKS